MKYNEIDFNIYMQKAYNIKDDDLCWCNSGKKYQKCHKNIRFAKKASLGEVERIHRLRLKQHFCLHPKKEECSGKIIDAHSIQKSKSISSIASDGHVFVFEADFGNLNDYIKYQTMLPKKIGISIASTFKGFCSHHDRELFLEIDTKHIEPTNEQSALLSIRSIAKEIYIKTIFSNNDSIKQAAQKGKDILNQARIEEMLNLHSKGNEIAIRDLFTHYNKFLEMFYTKDYNNLHRLVIKIDKVPEIMCSSCIFPEMYLKGNSLQTLNVEENVLDVITIEILSNGNDGIIQFCWHHNSFVCEQFINSILEKKIYLTLLQS